MPKAIPDEYRALTPYLAMKDAGKAIEFYKAALGATELYRLPMPDGKVAHAELKVGDARFMLADALPGWGNRTAGDFGGTPVSLVLFSENVDALAERFVKAGGKQVRPLENQFYGDRSGMFEDPEGYRWMLSQHVEDVPPEEMRRRMAKMMGG